jgi:hypothetical protein
MHGIIVAMIVHYTFYLKDFYSCVCISYICAQPSINLLKQTHCLKTTCSQRAIQKTIAAN